jgi:DnaK suppressor protein
MDKLKIEYFKNKLIAEQITILDQLSLSKQKQLVVDSDGDEADEIQANTIVEIDSALSNRSSLKLEKIKVALDKIKSNEFGICEDCEEEIPEKRLEFNPCFITCVKCAEQREFEAKQRINK